MQPLLIAQMILAIALMAAILLQQRGTGLGGAFGGEVTAYRSRRGIRLIKCCCGSANRLLCRRWG